MISLALTPGSGAARAASSTNATVEERRFSSSVAAVVGVAQRPKQVAQLVVAPNEPRAFEHLRKRLLNEIFGVVARPRQRERCAIHRVDVIW
jgi:hypothetical protein